MIQLTDTELFKLSTALEVPYETLQKLYSMQMLHEPTVFNVLIKDDYKRISHREYMRGDSRCEACVAKSIEV